MKLNEEWDQVYHNATMRLQHRMEALELENAAIKQLNSRLLLKVEHQQVSTTHSQQEGSKKERRKEGKTEGKEPKQLIRKYKSECVTDGTLAKRL